MARLDLTPMGRGGEAGSLGRSGDELGPRPSHQPAPLDINHSRHLISRLTVEGEWPSNLAIDRVD